MRVQQKLVLDAINKNEQLQEIKNRQQLMIDQKDPVMCQQCTFSIGCEELQQDKQADKVFKQNDLTCIRKYFYILWLLLTDS